MPLHFHVRIPKAYALSGTLDRIAVVGVSMALCLGCKGKPAEDKHSGAADRKDVVASLAADEPAEAAALTAKPADAAPAVSIDARPVTPDATTSKPPKMPGVKLQTRTLLEGSLVAEIWHDEEGAEGLGVLLEFSDKKVLTIGFGGGVSCDGTDVAAERVAGGNDVVFVQLFCENGEDIFRRQIAAAAIRLHRAEILWEGGGSYENLMGECQVIDVPVVKVENATLVVSRETETIVDPPNKEDRLGDARDCEAMAKTTTELARIPLAIDEARTEPTPTSPRY